MPTLTFTRNYTGVGAALNTSEIISNEEAIDLDVTINDGETDKEVVVAIDNSQLKGLVVHSDQAITLETNNGTTPDDTLVLVAGVPVEFTENGGVNPFASLDVAKIFVTNGSGAAARLRLKAVLDSTP